MTDNSPFLGAKKYTSKNTKPRTVVIDPAIDASSQCANQYPLMAAKTPKHTESHNIFFKSEVSKYAAAAGAIIRATTSMAPTTSKAPTTVIEDTDISP